MTQLLLLEHATNHARALGDSALEQRLLSREVGWLSRLETTAQKPPPFDELEALCAVLGLDPAETAKGNPP